MNHRNIHYTSFIVHCTYPFLLLLPFVVACSTTRAIPEGEQLYTGIDETRFVDDPAELRKKKQRDSTGVITAVANAVTAVNEALEGRSHVSPNDLKAANQPLTKEEKKAAGHSDGDLKLLLSDKLKAGKKTEVKKLFEKYGVTCLTALLEAQKDNLDAVYEEAEGI